MEKHTVTFRLDADKRSALDAIAASMDRDRTYVLNEAVETYLEIHGWQSEHIREGLRQADAGEFASDEEVSSALAHWGK